MVLDILPSLVIQQTAAHAVHTAVSTVFGDDGNGRCVYYAAVGALVLAQMTGKPYSFNSGSFQVVYDHEGMALSFDADDPLIDGLEFHSILLCPHPNGRIEVADLTSRHWKTRVEGSNLRWTLPEPPPFVWGWHDTMLDLWPAGIHFTANVALTEQHHRHLMTRGLPTMHRLYELAMREVGW